MLPTKYLIELGLILVLVGGSVVMSILSAGITCAATGENCDDVWKIIGKTIFMPQQQISNAIKDLQPENLQSISSEYRESYVTNKQRDIIFASIVSLIWIWLAIKVFMMLPAMDDLGTRILVLILVLIMFGLIQTLYGYYSEGTFYLPWWGFVELFSNWDVMSATGNAFSNITQAVNDAV